MSQQQDTAARSTSSSVEVAADPATAFTVFTEEMDLWWVRGPINHHAAGRMLSLRCEPGVGGRVLEVYGEGDALELARITVWEPGRQVAWRSSLDDVSTAITFTACDIGTLVTVTSRVPGGGSDDGGSSWVRVVPRWFGAWCDRRDHVPHTVQDIARLALAVGYDHPITAARWLAGAFGFTPDGPLPEDGAIRTAEQDAHTWLEFRIGNSSLMVVARAGGPGVAGAAGGAAPSHLPWVYVDDVEAHHRRAVGFGAAVVQPLASPWGLPMYTAADLEGHHWTFAQARPTMR